jgi:hypothetical protein
MHTICGVDEYNWVFMFCALEQLESFSYFEFMTKLSVRRSYQQLVSEFLSYFAYENIFKLC